MTTLQNSTKLLAHVLALMVFVLTVVTIVSGLTTSDNSTAVDVYQTLYSQRNLLEHQRDSLQQQLSRFSQNVGSPHDPAALLSVFCQSPISSLSLFSIAIRSFPKDSVAVEAVGNARRANNIFEYSKAVNTVVAPRQLSLASFQPEIQQTSSGPDTTLRFRLGFTVSHGN